MLSQLIISEKLSQLVQWSLRQEVKLRIWLRQIILRLAILRAFQKFARCHPRWAASLFDEYFLTGRAAPLLTRYVQTGLLPSADELAMAWADQLGPLAPSPYSLRRVEAKLAAANFLGYLETELRKYQIFHAQTPHGVTL